MPARSQLIAYLCRQQRRPFLGRERPHPAPVPLGQGMRSAADKPLGAKVEAQVVARHGQTAHDRLDEATAEQSWGAVVVAGKAVRLYGGIAGKQLVATVATQGDLDMASS